MDSHEAKNVLRQLIGSIFMVFQERILDAHVVEPLLSGLKTDGRSVMPAKGNIDTETIMEKDASMNHYAANHLINATVKAGFEIVFRLLSCNRA